MSSFYVNNFFLPLLLPAYGMCDGGVLVEFSFDVPRYSSGLDWRSGLWSYSSYKTTDQTYILYI
jgi:hypothetical protein